ncbi:hypothetical protein ACI0ZS_003125 [Cronobacter turicensis]|nr:hypothetical protein [Cronobacter turicensis]
MTTIVPAMQDSYAASSEYYARKKGPEAVILSPDKTSAVQSGSEPNVNAGQSKAEQEKNLQNLLTQRRAVLEQQANSSVPGLVLHSEISDNFADFSKLSTLSSLDMGSLLSEALNTPSASTTNSTTSDMDLAMQQGKLNYLVTQFVPQENQAKAQEMVSGWLAKKTAAQDDMMKTMTKAFIDIAKQNGDMASMKQSEAQLSLLDAGKSASQKARSSMLAVTATSSSAPEWFSGFVSNVNASQDPASVKQLEKAHIDALKSQWDTFLARIGSVTR